MGRPGLSRACLSHQPWKTAMCCVPHFGRCMPAERRARHICNRPPLSGCGCLNCQLDCFLVFGLWEASLFFHVLSNRRVQRLQEQCGSTPEWMPVWIVWRSLKLKPATKDHRLCFRLVAFLARGSLAPPFMQMQLMRSSDISINSTHLHCKNDPKAAFSACRLPCAW